MVVIGGVRKSKAVNYLTVMHALARPGVVPANTDSEMHLAAH